MALRTAEHRCMARTASEMSKRRRKYARWGWSTIKFESVTDCNGFRAVPAGLV